MKLEYALVIVISVAVVVASLIVFFSNKEQKKQSKEILDKTRMDWAKCLASVENGYEKANNALKFVISAKDEVIAEKDKRIQQLEAQISLNEMIMACAKIDGSIDIEAIKKQKAHWNC